MPSLSDDVASRVDSQLTNPEIEAAPKTAYSLPWNPCHSAAYRAGVLYVMIAFKLVLCDSAKT